MRYFHRTSLDPDAALETADAVLGGRLETTETAARRRVFRGPIGRVTVDARAEGGHYTLVTVETDQVAESEADKLAKRFLGVVHTKVEPDHELRGAY